MVIQPAFANGNMFAGVFEDGIIFRFREHEREELIQSGYGNPFAPMPGRAMKGYVVEAREFLKDREVVRRWLGQALAHTFKREPKSKVRKLAGKRSRQKPA